MMHQVDVRTRGVRSTHRNRKLWESFYCGWDRASLNLPPDPPESPASYGFGAPDLELADYHRMGHAARMLGGPDA